MNSPVCAVCGQPVVERTGSPAPSLAPFLFFLGRRWVFCGPVCRLAFKRDAVRVAEAHPDRGLVPYPDQVVAPPRPERKSPFANLMTVKALKGRTGNESPGPDAEAAEAAEAAVAAAPVVSLGPSEQGET